jgi:NAD(P)-dependent dehydrogenase (short-subunit alcohol dehydrogenase family)
VLRPIRHKTQEVRSERFFVELPNRIDHVMVTAGRPQYGRLLGMDFEEARRALDMHVTLMFQVARSAVHKVRPEARWFSWEAPGAAAKASGWEWCRQSPQRFRLSPPSLALELAPVRVNLIAAGFVDTPLSASFLGDELDNCRNHLPTTLPIRRVVTAADVVPLAVHLMVSTALTGTTYDVDGGQQLVAG